MDTVQIVLLAIYVITGLVFAGLTTIQSQGFNNSPKLIKAMYSLAIPHLFLGIIILYLFTK